jgi:hypothetical protein
MADVFLSYSQKDRARAQELASTITGMGHSVWWDTNLVGGETFRDAILSELEAARAVIVLWSPNAAASRFVIDEADAAAATGKLVSVMLDGFPASKLPLGFRSFQGLAYQDKSGLTRALQRLNLLGSGNSTEVYEARQAEAAKFLKARKSVLS